MIYEKIKEMRMNAIKSKDESLKGVLTVLLGEVDRVKHSSGTSDDVIVSVVQKMVKNANETIKICKSKNVESPESIYLISVLDNFRPKTLSEVEIRLIVEAAVDHFGKHSPMSTFMSHFKSFTGMNMSVASTILKELING